MNKKAIAVNQLFILMVSVIVIGLVMYLGVKAVGMFTEQTCDIEYVDVSQNIRDVIIDVSSDFGSRKKLEVRLTCDAERICIADGALQEANAGLASAEQDVLFKQTATLLNQESIIAADEYEQGDKNVFLLSDKNVEYSLLLPQLTVAVAGDEKVLCLDGPRATFKVDGGKRVAVVSEWVGTN